MHITFPFVNEETLLYATSKVLSNVQPKVPCICFEHAFFEPQQCDLYTTLQSPFSLIISKVCKNYAKLLIFLYAAIALIRHWRYAIVTEEQTRQHDDKQLSRVCRFGCFSMHITDSYL